MKKNIVWFDQVDKNDIPLVGGKGANLGEMLNAGFPIPYGFVVTSNAYFYYIKHNNLEQKIKNLLSIVNYNNAKELTDISKAIKKIIFDGEIPKDLVTEINDHYENLLIRENKMLHKKGGVAQAVHRIRSMYQPPLVAVRSSATAEDLPGASFAGQQETFLNVKGEHDLIQKVRECWASLFNERAIYYRHEQGFDHFRVGLAAVVQRMVQSDSSGICFTIDPVTNNKKVITIEAVFGLGEYIVQGVVSPDHYEVDKHSFEILKREVATQNVKLVKKNHDNIEVKIGKKEGSVQKISDEQIVKLSKIVKNIEKHYYFPQDIEWAVEKGNMFIVQSRPITTIKTNNTESEIKKDASNVLLLKGDQASPGVGIGSPVVIKSPKEIDKIKKGDILVAEQTNPDYVPAMKKASAIVTERGGRTSHAAIVSRELGIPAVVGAEKATHILAHEKTISVNGSSGEIYRGSITIVQDKHQVAQQKKYAHIKTKTKIYVNLAEPEQADRIAQENVDGIGLLRAEFMMAEIGVHPKEIIRQKKQHVFVNKLVTQIEKFVKPFNPRPVIYRATDFKTNEYRYLEGGKLYEPKEENPMIGYRGASRYIADKEVFLMELQAIKKVRDMGYKNLHLMIPFIRTPVELVQIRAILEEFGLLNLPTFKLWIMVEVPSTVIMLEEFIKIGIDGVSVGTNDLTMLLLGVDRDNQEIAHLYNERNPAVLWALEKIVKTTTSSGVTCSVCGQAPSDYPEIVEKLVSLGITSLSVNPDVINKTRIQVHEIENKLCQK